ncbi:hypothetical protein NQ318_008564 [Aromia moschata]|uniref:Uncharacterized protein n=1 Tax=Aromia moschata TaxID=1265417 RepID=A0AAV8YXF0_9CUCU|nr:hypothetical protein NQ318_008564 [Aromia moschata]
MSFDRPCTKRGILSELARVYDPLGYLTPVTFYIKHLLQQIWHSSCDWDDSLPEPLTRQWLKYKSEIYFLSDISVDRQLIFDRNSPFIT